MAKTVTISGMSFEIFKLPMLRRIVLDRKVARMMRPIFESLGSLDFSAIAAAVKNPDMAPDEIAELERTMGESLDTSVLFKALDQALSALSDDEFMAFAKDLLSVVSCRHPVHGATLLDTPDAIAMVFADLAPLDLYRLAIEVMRENKFSPFALSGDGSERSKTPTSGPGKASPAKSGLKLGRSASSTNKPRTNGPTGEP